LKKELRPQKYGKERKGRGMIMLNDFYTLFFSSVLSVPSVVEKKDEI